MLKTGNTVKYPTLTDLIMFTYIVIATRHDVSLRHMYRLNK